MKKFALALGGVFLFSVVATAATRHCDFNKDGFDDLAIGVPREDFADNTTQAVGAVHVLYGTARGLTATGNQYWHRDSPGIPGEPGDPDNFGTALACGDFDKDGYSDLAIGASGACASALNCAFAERGGVVHVLYGSDSGLTSQGNQVLSPNRPGQFGEALAAGDFNGDGFSDLAIGAPNEALPGTTDFTGQGAVHILYGGTSGLSADNKQFFHQDTPEIPGTASRSERFGLQLEAANFGRDTNANCFDDLVISVDENPGTSNLTQQAGAVHVLYGSSSGLMASGSQFFHQNSPGMPGEAGGLDHFGASLAAGIFGGVTSVCGEKLSDLAIGIPGEDFVFTSGLVRLISRAGAIQILYATNNGLTTAGNQYWHQSTPGIADTRENFDEFGSALATGRTTSGRDYLAVGSPGESFERPDVVNIVFASGTVHIFFTASGGRLTTANRRHYHQDIPGIENAREDNDHFGFALATGNFNGFGNDDLVIGATRESLNQAVEAGIVHVLYGAATSSTQIWHQNTANIPDSAEREDWFGFTFAD